MTDRRNPISPAGDLCAKIQFAHCPRCGRAGLAGRGDSAVHCRACGFVYYHSTVAAVVGIVEHDHRIVVTRRARDPHKGEWAIPGGFVEPGETLEKALARELKEELSLEIDQCAYLASFASEYLYRGVLYFPIVAYFTCPMGDIGALRPKDDVDQYRLVPAAQLLEEELAFDADRRALRAYGQQTD